MSLNTWRQFQLFENIPIKDPFIESDNALYSDPTITALASLNRERLAIAVQGNLIKIISLHDMFVELQFEAYTTEYQVTYLERVSDTFVLSVGECSGKPVLIKLWNLDNAPNGEDKYHALAEVRNGSNTYPVSTISCNLSNSCLAVGFTDGRIILVRGDLMRDRGSKFRIIYEDPGKEPITSLALNNEATHVFATTTSRIMLFNTSGRANGKPDLTLNETEGADLNCGVLSPQSNEFLVLMKNRVDIYSNSGSKRSLVADVSTAKRIFPVSKDQVLLLMANVGTSILNLGKTPKEATRVYILDSRNKIVSYSVLITSVVVDIFSDESSVNLLTSDGVIHKLKEKSVSDQLETICQKDMYPVALQFAKQFNLPEIEIQEIRLRYANSLFKKGSKKMAMEEYMECLDICDPTEIISKYGAEPKTNSEDSTHLKDFLWKLLKENRAKVDHVSLLLTLLIKLNDLEGLELFISHYGRDGVFFEAPEEFGQWSMSDDSYFYSDKTLFDLDIVLWLLIESNLLELAHKFVLKYSKDPLQVVDVVLLRQKNALGALNYTKSLPVDDALRVLIKYSRKLLDKVPNETNLLLIDLFTGKYQAVDYKAELNESSTNKKSTSFFSEKAEPIVFYNYRSFFEYMLPSSVEQDGKSRAIIQTPTYHPPKPNLIFSSFVQKPFEFVVFLEACLESYKRFQGYDQDRQDILTTLYDVYLSLSEDDIEERKVEWKNKAGAILVESENVNRSLKNEKPADNSLMLLISHMHDMNPFTVSTALNQEEDEHSSALSHLNISDVFRTMCLTTDAKQCINFLDKYGSKDHELYRIAIGHFASSKQVYENIGGEAVFKNKVLDKILEFDLMSPLDIIQTLSSSTVVKYGVIKEFLVAHLKRENEEIKKNELLVDSYKKELKQKMAKLKESLATEAPIQFKVKNRLCDASHMPIEFPMVYFKSGYLYNQRSLNEETDSELLYNCPQCVVETDAAKKTMREYKNSAQNADLLRAALSDLDPKEDRFAIISDFIAKGGLDDPDRLISQV